MIALLATLWVVVSPADSAALADSLERVHPSPAVLAPSAARDSSAASAAAPRSAATADTTRPVLVLPEVRVDEARPALDAHHRLPSAFVTDVAAGSTGHAVETVPELLSRAAAVRIQQYGGLGAFATVSIRGAPANQTAFYLDGAPLTSAAQSVIDVSELPVTAIDRIEVYRGLSPLDLGPVTPGGAINILTLPAGAPARVSLARGSFGTWEGLATGGARRGSWSATGHAGWQGTRGDFSYHDDNGTPFNPDDDAIAHRQNAGFDSRTLLGAVRGALPLGVALTARASAFHKAQGVPGLGAVPALHTHLAMDRAIGQVTLERQVRGAAPGVRLDTQLDRDRTRFRDLAHELGSRAFDTDDRTHSDRAVVDVTSPRLPGGLTVTSSAGVRREHADLSDAADGRPDPPESRRATRSASVELALRPWGDRLLLAAGRRWDRQHDALHWLSPLGVATASDLWRTLDAPQLRGDWRAPLGLELKVNWGRTTRAPEFLELFGDDGSVIGNPALVPERAETWDAGGGWTSPRSRFGRAELEWAHYETHARDLVAYVRNSASSVKAQNIARARIRGEELSATLDLPRGVAITGWTTRQSTIDLGDVPAWHGRRLPLRPERHAFVQLNVRRRLVEAGGDVEWIGADYLDRANRGRVGRRTLAGVSLTWHALSSLALTLEGKNLGNDRATDVAGFPLPGRGLFASMRFEPAAIGSR